MGSIAHRFVKRHRHPPRERWRRRRPGLLGRETFTETFGHLYPPRDLAAFLDAAHAPAHYADMAADPAFALWIAESDGRAVGYAEAGRCLIRHPEVTPECGELQRLYVRREAQGGGLGVQLLETAFAWLERSGRRLWIGCWSENFGAQRLYGRYDSQRSANMSFPWAIPAIWSSFWPGPTRARARVAKKSGQRAPGPIIFIQTAVRHFRGPIMFMNFFSELREAKVPVTLKEYLMLMEALDRDVIDKSVDEFYYLSRAALVKDEKNLDKFDQVFGHVFKGLEKLKIGRSRRTSRPSG